MTILPPSEAGFDGEAGIRLNHPALDDGGIFRLRRGTTAPWITGGDFRNQLVWLKTSPPQLLYCNADGEWFELLFQPVQQ